MQLEVKTILNRIQRFAGFVYEDIRFGCKLPGRLRIEVSIESHRHVRGKCSQCLKPAPTYDHLPQRNWLYVPLWGITTFFLYAPRRVGCPEHGVVVEHIPWSDGKRPVTITMMCFLSRWARRLSWRETARVFRTSWECVYRSVEWFVHWGLAHRKLGGVRAIGVDEIHWGQGRRADSFLTVIYQIDRHCRRLLWVGRRRTQRTLHSPLRVIRVLHRVGAGTIRFLELAGQEIFIGRHGPIGVGYGFHPAHVVVQITGSLPVAVAIHAWQLAQEDAQPRNSRRRVYHIQHSLDPRQFLSSMHSGKIEAEVGMFVDVNAWETLRWWFTESELVYLGLKVPVLELEPDQLWEYDSRAPRYYRDRHRDLPPEVAAVVNQADAGAAKGSPSSST